MAQSHLAVKELHAQFLPACGVAREVPGTAEKVAVLMNHPFRGYLIARSPQCRQHPVLARAHTDDPLRTVRSEKPSQLGGKRAGIVRVVEFSVVNDPALLDLILPEMTHGGEEEGNSLLMGPDVPGLLGDLGHPDGVVGGIEALQSDTLRVELIAQDDYQVPNR